jgi:hypothetical protein
MGTSGNPQPTPKPPAPAMVEIRPFASQDDEFPVSFIPKLNLKKRTRARAGRPQNVMVTDREQEVAEM